VRQVEKHSGDRKTISLTTESGQFQFSNVIPGKYRLEVDIFFAFPFHLWSNVSFFLESSDSCVFWPL